MAKRVYFSGWVDIPEDTVELYGVSESLLDQFVDHGPDFVDALDYDYQVTSVTDIDDEYTEDYDA